MKTIVLEREVIQAFRPFPLLANPHLQTLIAAKLAWASAPPSVTHYVPLIDGDCLALEISTPASWCPEHRTVVLLHGLCGCHGSPYMQRLARKLWQCGIRAVRMNMRGCGSGQGLARRAYHSGRSADVLAVLHAIQQAAPHTPITLVGFSLGGNIVLKLAGELGDTASQYMQQVIAVCPPVDLAACARKMEEPGNRIYNRHFTRLLQQAVDARHAHFPELPAITWPPRLTLAVFDQMYTAPQHGFRDAFDYYEQSSAAPLLPSIRIPCYMLVATDDPMVDSTIFALLALPPQVRLVRTAYGGHLGFLGLPGSACGYRAMDAQIVAWITQSTCPQ